MSERLTKRLLGSNAPYTEFADYNEIIERLCDLEDKIEQGKIVELPCRVGQTVYICTCFGFWYTVKEINKCEMQIKSIRITDNRIIFEAESGKDNVDYFELKEIGKTVFLDRASAEAKLREMEVDNDEQR